MTTLSTPKKVGPFTFSPRVVLAPMTRLRTIVPDEIASSMMADGYGQRLGPYRAALFRRSNVRRRQESVVVGPTLLTHTRDCHATSYPVFQSGCA
jgi:N-ethylmaleimide reductase